MICVKDKAFSPGINSLGFFKLNNLSSETDAEVIIIDTYHFVNMHNDDIQYYLDSNKCVYIDSTYEMMEQNILEKISVLNNIHNIYYFYNPRKNENNNQLLILLRERGLNCISRQHFIDNASVYEPYYQNSLPNKKYACLTGKLNISRIFLVSLLSKYNLLDHGHVSFFNTDSIDKNFTQSSDIKTLIDSSKFSIENKYIMNGETARIRLPLVVDSNVLDSKLSHERMFNASIYDSVDFVIVPETEGNVLREEFFVTEKTIKCILMNKKFVAIASRFFIKKLKEYYMNNFSKDISHLTDWCDTSYDEIESLEERIEKVVEIVNSQVKND
jgi:hypothetical protein